MKRKKETSEKHKNIVFLNVCCVMMLCVFLCRSVCWFLYGPFCHGALKLDVSTLFTTFFIWTSLQFIFVNLYRCFPSQCLYAIIFNLSKHRNNVKSYRRVFLLRVLTDQIGLTRVAYREFRKGGWRIVRLCQAVHASPTSLVDGRDITQKQAVAVLGVVSKITNLGANVVMSDLEEIWRGIPK